MTRFLTFKNFFLTLIVCVFLTGCNEGDIRQAGGTYEVTVVNSKGTSSVGSASVTHSGDFFSLIIHSSVGDFAFSGNLLKDVIDVTYTDAKGGTVTAKVEFSIDRSTFTGSIQTSSGLFVILGIHL